MSIHDLPTHAERMALAGKWLQWSLTLDLRAPVDERLADQINDAVAKAFELRSDSEVNQDELAELRVELEKAQRKVEWAQGTEL